MQVTGRTLGATEKCDARVIPSTRKGRQPEAPGCTTDDFTNNGFQPCAVLEGSFLVHGQVSTSAENSVG